MASRNKQRGNELEREVVKAAEAVGLAAKRAYASNGQSLGYTDNVDCTITYSDAMLKVQCKRKKKLPDYLVLDRLGIDYDAVVFREDRGKPYIMMKLDNFLEIIK